MRRANYKPIFASFLLSVVTIQCMLQSSASLSVGYYKSKCPNAEGIVADAVRSAITGSGDRGIGAGLIRLHFHDCFVRGCDASVLLDGPNTEKTAPPNLSLRGFEVIDTAKSQLESACPGKVSCADILAFAARDSVVLLGGVNYTVPSGRLDGSTSSSSEAMQFLPPPFGDVSQIQSMFAVKGLTLDDMVILSGAHAVGRSHCSSFSNRLYSWNSPDGVDPSMDKNFAAYLKTKCPENGGGDPVVDMNVVTPNKFNTRYYKLVKAHKVLFTSDQTLLNNAQAAALVNQSSNQPYTWPRSFNKAMLKMGAIEILTSANGGRIRKNCRVAN
ncbi:Peroxidase 2 [Ananas comosus]|uniref:Peroxidase n=2 Tax=Ananas comosus TaxID=4615 RepID=A0A199V8W7_ANACO|nr:Peroxidase 2 [Ananas comosus]